MADVIVTTTGTVPEATEVETPATVTTAAQAPAPAVDVASEIKKALEESDKKWQSRFDKVLTEKKTVETAKLTIEERIAKVEAERTQERMTWARKEARAKATISDELDVAIATYVSDDIEGISNGAVAIRKVIDAEVAQYKAKVEALEKQIKYGSNPPPGGGSATAENTFSKSAMKKDPVLRKKYSDAILANKGVSLTD